MSTIGIIGGLGPESTVDYYQRILREYKRLAGTTNNPRVVIVSVDIVETLSYVAAKDYSALEALLSDAVSRLERSGADFAAIASNTPHVVFDALKKESSLELLSIVDATCAHIKQRGYGRSLLTGTLFTMRENFYSDVAFRHGVNLVIPADEDKLSVHDVIFPELEDGVIIPEKKAKYIELVHRYVQRERIDSVILGCTELPLMISPADVPVPVINTTEVHVAAIIERSLARDGSR
jgi:aspartate racemase